MATELPATTVATPAATTTVTPVVHRSWKARIVTLASAAVAFVLALAQYLQTVNLANFGITADRALFYMACLGLLQFVLMQFGAIKGVEIKAEPGSGGQG